MKEIRTELDRARNVDVIEFFPTAHIEYVMQYN